jgi:DNA replication and repair protein RecF
LIGYFNKILSQKYQEISNKNQALYLDYKNKIFTANLEDARKNFFSQIEMIKEKEIMMQKTLIGPQRDNLIFKIDNRNVEFFGSRGEIRSVILALKLAEIEFLTRKNENDPPLFLLDDVFSELDEERREFLVKQLEKTQVIITTCDLRTIPVGLREKAKIVGL